MRTTRSEPAIVRAWSRVIALDGGTSNTWARLIPDGRIVASARRTVGVRDSVLSDRSSGQRLAGAVREVIAEAAGFGDGPAQGTTPPPGPDLIVAGMLSSEEGLLAVPHVLAPRAFLSWPMPWWLVHFHRSGRGRSISCRDCEPAGPDGWMRTDVMRGEECETLGALAELTRRGLLEPGQGGLIFVWPGSHSKLVEVDGQGRITRSQTTLAGELIQSVARHTLIAASLPAEFPLALDIETAEAGARATQGQGLEWAAFLVPGLRRSWER